MSDTDRPDSVRTTDLGIPTKKVYIHAKVKVELLGEPAHHARVTTKLGSPFAADLLIPASYVQKRMLPNERVAFFRAHVTNTVGDLELDDRLSNEVW